METIDNVNWYTLAEMVEREEVTKPTIIARAKKGIYFKEQMKGIAHYAYNDNPAPEAEIDNELAEYAPSYADFEQCQRCGAPLDGLTEEIKQAVSESTVTLIKAKTKKLQGLVLSAEKLKEQLEKVETETESINNREREITSREVELEENLKDYNELKAGLDKKEAELKELEARLNKDKEEWEGKKPEIVDAVKNTEMANKQNLFEDYVYQRYCDGIEKGVVIPIGAPTYKNIFGLDREDAIDVWEGLTSNWPEAEKHKRYVQIN